VTPATLLALPVTFALGFAAGWSARFSLLLRLEGSTRTSPGLTRCRRRWPAAFI
jgi:hypothetical protein